MGDITYLNIYILYINIQMVPYGNYSLNSYFDASDFLFYHEYDLMQLLFMF